MRNYADIELNINSCKVACSEAYDKGYLKGYKEGLNEAWECARKIHDMAKEAAEDDFSRWSFMQPLLKGFSAIEAIAKIKEHEQKQTERRCMSDTEIEQLKDCLANDILNVSENPTGCERQINCKALNCQHNSSGQCTEKSILIDGCGECMTSDYVEPQMLPQEEIDELIAFEETNGARMTGKEGGTE